jgi:hypothetical protein
MSSALLQTNSTSSVGFAGLLPVVPNGSSAPISLLDELFTKVRGQTNPLEQGKLLRELDTLTGGRDFTDALMQSTALPRLPSRKDVEKAVKDASDSISDKAQEIAQAQAEESAKTNIRKYINDPSTSPAAREVLTAFLTGKGPRKFEYTMGSQGLAELLGKQDPGGYFKREVAGTLTYIMNREKRPYLKEGDVVTELTTRDFHQDLISVGKGLWDGAQIGDIVGTMSDGWKAEVKGGRIYFTAANTMNLTSFAGGNFLSNIGVRDYIKSPTSGPLSKIEMEFKFDMPLPANLRAPVGK